jgi:hypothetical protein
MSMLRNQWLRLRSVDRHERELRRGRRYARAWTASPPDLGREEAPNALRAYFEAHTDGPGIWKWDHYFDLYHRHFSRFVGQKVDVVEIGIYSGGSLEMWLDYFGAGCHVYGVDVEESCRVYASDRVSVFIGDQADRSFWTKFTSEVPEVDIVIDDGGHEPEQQIVTLEEMLPRIRPGGIYLCEDIVGGDHDLVRFASGLVDELNRFRVVDDESPATPFQDAVYSIHFYPFVMAIERRRRAVRAFSSRRQGTEWQQFL